MKLLICAATAKEMAALAPHVFRGKTIEEMRPVPGRLRACDALFLVTGVGPVNAALAIGTCLGMERQDSPVSAILYAGLAGAFDLEKNPLCSIWHIGEEIWPEYGLNDGMSVTARAFSHPLWEPEEGAAVFDRMPLASVDAICHESAVAGNWSTCASLTVAGVSASFNRRDRLWNTYHAQLENMEGFSAAYAAGRANVPCVEIRTVSNKVGPRSREEKDFDGALLALGDILPGLNLL